MAGKNKEAFCRIVIEGENIHGVGYRPFLLRAARRLRVPRFEAENIEDAPPKIEVLAGGNASAIKEFVKTVKTQHPRDAIVSRVRVDPKPPESVLPIDEYDKILSAEQQDRIVSAGLAMLGKQDKTLEKQDGMLEKQERMLEKQDETTESIRHMDGNITETNRSIKEMDGHMTERFDRMDQKYDKMSERMEHMDHTLERLADALIKLAEKKG